MIDHDQQNPSQSDPASDRDPTSGRTGRAASSLVRKTFDERAAACVDGVLRGCAASGDRRASNRAIGDALGVDESRVRALREGRAPWRLGDLIAMGDSPETRAAALKLLDTLRALIVEHSPCVRLAPELRMLGVMTRVGELGAVVREAVSDGEVDSGESERITAHAMAVVSETHALVRESMLPMPPLAKAGPRLPSVALRAGTGAAR